MTGADGVERRQVRTSRRKLETIDTATGRRRSGAAPKPPTYIDAAGDHLLYGRHVVDVAQATLVATIADDALAIDRSGRVLVPAAEGQGPLRWRRP